MTSHSSTLLSTSPQLIPGMSLSLCICFNWRPRSPEAAELAMMGMEGRQMGLDRKRQTWGWTPDTKDDFARK